MGVGFGLLMIVLLILIPYLGVMAGGEYVLGVLIPYLAFAIFIVGVIYRIVSWAKSPVPFRITTTCGQQKTHDWIKSDQVENPTTTLGVWARMAKEVFLFRSLSVIQQRKLRRKVISPTFGRNGYGWPLFYTTIRFLSLQFVTYGYSPRKPLSLSVFWRVWTDSLISECTVFI